MAVAAAGFVGYALFLVRNFTHSFLELGINAGEVDIGKDQIQQFIPSLYHYGRAAAGHLRRPRRAGLDLDGRGGGTMSNLKYRH